MSGFDDPFWTFEQAIAWIAFNDRELVDAASSNELRRLRPRAGNSKIYFDQNPLGRYMHGHDPKSEIKQSFRRAKEELRAALQLGDVVATNRQRGSDRREELNKLHWADNGIGVSSNGTLCSTLQGKLPAYDDEVRFESARIKERWPAQSVSAVEKRSAEEMAYDEFYRTMKASPHMRLRTRDPWVKELVAKFPGLTPTAAKSEWRQAAIDAGAHAWRGKG